MTDTIRHVVRQGEDALSIAAQYGLADVHSLLNHPDNRGLLAGSRHPTMLVPGDVITVPVERRRHTIRPGGRHDYQMPAGLQVVVRLRVELDRAAVADKKAYVRVGDHTQTVQFGPDGMLEVTVPARATQIDVALPDSDEHLVLHMGALWPIDTLRGIAARLRNLGLYGLPDTARPATLVPAILQFRALYMPPPTPAPKHPAAVTITPRLRRLSEKINPGEPLVDDAFLSALEKAHGC